jgi:uncharacterized protein
MKYSHLPMTKADTRALVFSLACLITSIAHADYEAGLEAVQRGDFDTAFREFSLAAEEGLDVAQYNLAILYFTGRGVNQDYQQAFSWTSKAAEQGHIGAQFNLGVLYYAGDGTRRDRSLAFAWYERAARAGHAQAQYNLATMYRDGIGTVKDIINAHAWASLSLENEFADAAELITSLESRMNKAQQSEARRQFARIKVSL